MVIISVVERSYGGKLPISLDMKLEVGDCD